jgi:hypothetical protein
MAKKAKRTQPGDFAEAIARAAENAASAFRDYADAELDYSEASLATVDGILARVAASRDEWTSEQLDGLAQDFGCYILEVARRQFGGRYCWFEQRDQPVLVVGEPTFHVALITWDKVKSRLSGDPADNIPFFYSGFADRVRRGEPGTDALYV